MNEVAVELASDAGPEALAADVAVAEVTLLEDRGLVVRRGRLLLPSGRSQLRIESVAPVLVDKTLAASIRDPDGGELPEGVRVRDVKVERWRVTQEADRPADIAALQAEIRAKETERAGVEHLVRSLEAEATALFSLEQLTLAEIAQDVGWARQEADRWEAQLRQLGERQRELGAAICERHQALRKIDRDLADLRRLAAAKEHLDAHAAAALVVEFVNPDHPRTVDLRIDYVVPGAAWRPWHSARLVEEAEQARVEFRTEGCVWQATGEDWNDVQIVFSTERPSLGISPPTLHTDRVSAFKRGSAVEVQAREQKIHTAGLGGGGETATVEAADDLPGIDDGGDALALRGRTRVSIPTDGRPHRVPISGFDAPADVALACTPELQAAVLLRSRQSNRSEQPLLAGPVDLIRGSGLVGRTSLLFIAPGERFELGWGPEPSLRVVREVEFLEQERRTLSSWTRKPRKVSVKLSNIGAVARTIELKERIAVSEIEKVEVELAESAPKAKADADGFVTWTLRLPGFAHETVALTWILVVHDDVVGL